MVRKCLTDAKDFPPKIIPYLFDKLLKEKTGGVLHPLHGDVDFAEGAEHFVKTNLFTGGFAGFEVFYHQLVAFCGFFDGVLPGNIDFVHGRLAENLKLFAVSQAKERHFAMDSPVSSMRRPVFPSSMPSEAQLSRSSTLALPQAAASLTTMPLVSKEEGNKNKSERVKYPRIISPIVNGADEYTFFLYAQRFCILLDFGAFDAVSHENHAEILAVVCNHFKSVEDYSRALIPHEPAHKEKDGHIGGQGVFLAQLGQVRERQVPFSGRRRFP